MRTQRDTGLDLSSGRHPVVGDLSSFDLPQPSSAFAHMVSAMRGRGGPRRETITAAKYWAGPDNSFTTLARATDLTLLDPTATKSDFALLVDKASKCRPRSLCVPSSKGWRVAADMRTAGLFDGNNPVRLCMVVGFPHGNALSAAKVTEAKEAIKFVSKFVESDLVDIDMVINPGQVREGDIGGVANEVWLVRGVIGDATLKVILCCELLKADEITALSNLLAHPCGPLYDGDFLKTNTGFQLPGKPPASATCDAVKAIRKGLEEAGAENSMGIKAAGGVKTLAGLHTLHSAGATVFGMSSGYDAIRAEIENILAEGKQEPAPGIDAY